MAYADPLDPTTPGENDKAGRGDDQIRELKRALTQRLETFFTGLGIDPLVPRQGSIPSDIFPDNSIDGKALGVGTIPADRLVGGGVITDPAPNSVDSEQLKDHAVTNLKLADGSVDSRVLADLSVGTTELQDEAVNTRTIADGGVTRVKLDSTMRAVLTHWLSGSFVVPGGGVLAGPTYFKAWDINIATNEKVAQNALAIVNPVVGGVITASWTSGLIIDCEVFISSGVQVTLRIRVRDSDNDGAKDLTGRVFSWAVVQAYEGAVPE